MPETEYSLKGANDVFTVARAGMVHVSFLKSEVRSVDYNECNPFDENDESKQPGLDNTKGQFSFKTVLDHSSDFPAAW